MPRLIIETTLNGIVRPTIMTRKLRWIRTI